MTQTIIYPSVMGSIDFRAQSSAFQNYSDLGVFWVGASKGAMRRFYFVFDLFAAPSSGPQLNLSSVITAAVLELYAPSKWPGATGVPPPYNAHIYRLTRTNLDGSGTTWLNYKAASAWTTQGGDYDSTTPTPIPFATPAAADFPATQDIAALTFVQDAQSLRGGKLAILIELDNETPASGNDTFQAYESSLGAPDPQRGHLIITTPGVVGAKQSGFPYKFFIGGVDLSGDVGALSKIAAPSALSDITDLLQAAPSRIYGERDGEIDFNIFYNPAREHSVLKLRPKTDQIAMLFTGSGVGVAVASLVGKQINYDWNRARDGSLLGQVQVMGDGGGSLEWGDALTGGLRDDTAATNGDSLDNGAATAYGLAAYLEVFAFTGTSVTVKVQDSADNVTFGDLLTFTAVAGAPAAERLETALNATVRRYLRVITTGTFSNVVLACAAVRYLGPREPL